jgi:TRAP-type C4-dicarboxylate transport system permease large subunit
MTFCNALVGRFRGGLAQVNILQSIIFAGMSGSAIADAAGTGRMMQVMMTRGGRYTASYAAAVTVVSSVIGPIIPPSSSDGALCSRVRRRRSAFSSWEASFRAC